jgi:hypothetical protein
MARSNHTKERRISCTESAREITLMVLPDNIQSRLSYTAQREGVSKLAVVCKCLKDGLHQLP